MAAMQDSLAPAPLAPPKPSDQVPPGTAARTPHRADPPPGETTVNHAAAAHADERGCWIEVLKQLLERAEACVVRNFRVPPGGG